MLVDKSQYNPESNVQVEAPQKHGDLFDVVLSVSVHEGADKQMHSFLEWHGSVEDFALK